MKDKTKCTNTHQIVQIGQTQFCYQYFNGLKTWHEANKTCTDKNAHLPLPKNQEENHTFGTLFMKQATMRGISLDKLAFFLDLTYQSGKD